MMRRCFSPQEQAALLHAKRLAMRPETQSDAADLLKAIDRGIEDDAALEDVLRPTGASADALFAELDRMLFSGGQPVTLPVDPCPKSLSGSTRPCLLDRGHDGSCNFADVPIGQQRAAMAQFEQEMGAVVAAVAGARGGAQ